jgi:hypothetical protein
MSKQLFTIAEKTLLMRDGFYYQMKAIEDADEDSLVHIEVEDHIRCCRVYIETRYFVDNYHNSGGIWGYESPQDAARSLISVHKRFSRRSV